MPQNTTYECLHIEHGTETEHTPFVIQIQVIWVSHHSIT